MSTARRLLADAAAVLVVALLAWALIAQVGRASARETEARVRAEMRDSVAFAVARAITPLRRVAEAADARRLEAERALARSRARGDAALAAVDTASATALAVLRDSAATVPQLRGALVAQVATTDRLAAEFREYLAADTLAHLAAAESRVADRRLLTQTAAALVAMTEARDAWQRAAECRTVFRMRCPTRTQAAIGGALVTAAVVVAVRR